MGVELPPLIQYGGYGPNPAFCSIEHGRRRGRNDHLQKEYGITLEDFENRLEAQDGKCAICRTEDPESPGRPANNREQFGQSFSVDHDHKTGKVRGLLCSRCNRGLGWFHDDPNELRAALNYLLNAA